MFASVQFPLADLRPFLDDDTYRLAAPSWPLPDPEQEFVRSFGPVSERSRGGVQGWVGEDVYCSADNALKFEPFLGHKRLGPAQSPLIPVCAYRRLYTDGAAVSRVDIGLVHDGNAPRLRLRDAEGFLALARDILSLTVRIPAVGGDDEADVLCRAGAGLAEQYLRSTTKLEDGKPAEIRPEWMTPGRPQLVVECEPEELIELPSHARKISSEVLGSEDVSLHFVRVEIGDRTRIGLWILRRRKSADWDFVRRLRIHLTRLHTEREALRAVLRELTRQNVTPSPRTAASDRLQRYLRDSLRLLSGEQPYGIDRSEVFGAAYESENLVSEGERTALLSALEGIRHNIFASVSEFTRSDGRATTETVHQLVIQGSVRNLNVGDTTVEEQNVTRHEITIGDDNFITGNIAVAEHIESSFNRVAEAAVDETLKQKLEELTRAFAEIADQLPPDIQEQAARDLDTFTKEAISESPRKKWYELSAEGLLDAAKAVGDVAKPVAKAVTSILALLA